MKHEVSYQVQAAANGLPDRAAVVEHIRAYLECVGYRFAQEGDELVFRRGSLWGSIFGFAPLQWQATVRARVVQTPNRKMKASFVYDVKTNLQQVAGPEVDFWNYEVSGLERAVEGADAGQSIWVTAVQAAAREAAMNNWRAIARLVLMPLVLIPFVIAFCIGIGPLEKLVRELVAQVGPVAVTGALTAVLLVSTSTGMYWLPSGRRAWAQSPARLLLATVALSAYYGAFALLLCSALILLGVVEPNLWLVLLIALSAVGTAAAADQARRKK